MPRPETRFVILQYGRERRILSVRELTDKSLVLIFPVWKTTFGGSLDEPKDFHVTVHTQRDFIEGRGHKLKYTSITQSDEYDSSVIVLCDDASRFLWPVLSSLTDNLLSNDHDFQDSAGDNTIRLIGNTSSKETLCYSIVASSGQHEPPSIQGFSQYSVDFEAIRLTFYCTFLGVENVRITHNKPHRLGAFRKNKKLIEPQMSPIPTISAPTDLEKILYKTHLELAKNHCKMINSSETIRKGIVRPIRLNQADYRRWPRLTDELHYDYGVMARSQNDVYEAPNFPDGTPKPLGYQSFAPPMIVLENPKHGV